MLHWSAPLDQGSAKVSWKEPDSILAFTGYMVSVKITQLCHYHVEAAMDYVNNWEWLCSDKTLFTKAGGMLDLAHGSQFADPCTRPTKRKELFEFSNHVPSCPLLWKWLSLPEQQSHLIFNPLKIGKISKSIEGRAFSLMCEYKLECLLLNTERNYNFFVLFSGLIYI